MSPHLHKALSRLWELGDSADFDGSDRTITLVFSPTSFPIYHSIKTRAEKNQLHADLREIERQQMIAIEWDKRAGPDGQIIRLRLLNFPRLTTLLGMTSQRTTLSRAVDALDPWAALPAVQWILDQWRAGRKPRGVGASDVSDVVDACLLIENRRNATTLESVRRVSARVHSDSKRIETVIPAIGLALLGPNAVEITGLRLDEEIQQRLLLLRHPNPFLIAGSGSLKLSHRGSDNTQTILAPYLGVSPLQVTGVSTPGNYLLTIENLTVFHELANGAAGNVTGLVIYTGGFPSPAFVGTYRRMLKDLSSSVRILHWGDSDLGGFRIAEQLAINATVVGRDLHLWRMGEFDGLVPNRSLNEASLSSIRSICMTRGWTTSLSSLEETRAGIEQELQLLLLP